MPAWERLWNEKVAAEAALADANQRAEFWEGTANEMADVDIPKMVKRSRERVRELEAALADANQVMRDKDETWNELLEEETQRADDYADTLRDLIVALDVLPYNCAPDEVAAARAALDRHTAPAPTDKAQRDSDEDDQWHGWEEPTEGGDVT
jgi:small-conductance mechanosensitive channel